MEQSGVGDASRRTTGGCARPPPSTKPALAPSLPAARLAAQYSHLHCRRSWPYPCGVQHCTRSPSARPPPAPSLHHLLPPLHRKKRPPSASSRMTAVPVGPSTSRTSPVSTPHDCRAERSLRGGRAGAQRGRGRCARSEQQAWARAVSLRIRQAARPACMPPTRPPASGPSHLRLRVPPQLRHQAGGAAQARRRRRLVAALRGRRGQGHGAHSLCASLNSSRLHCSASARWPHPASPMPQPCPACQPASKPARGARLAARVRGHAARRQRLARARHALQVEHQVSVDAAHHRAVAARCRGRRALQTEVRRGAAVASWRRRQAAAAAATVGHRHGAARRAASSIADRRGTAGQCGSWRWERQQSGRGSVAPPRTCIPSLMPWNCSARRPETAEIDRMRRRRARAPHLGRELAGGRPLTPAAWASHSAFHRSPPRPGAPECDRGAMEADPNYRDPSWRYITQHKSGWRSYAYARSGGKRLKLHGGTFYTTPREAAHASDK